jgi:glycosyltransferase involved in cell wall biosynthesis
MNTIGIDSFGLGRNHYTGKEIYIFNLIKGLLATRNDISYKLFLPKYSYRIPDIQNQNIEIVTTPASRSYTLWNQAVLPFALKKTKLDAMIFTESMLPVLNIHKQCKSILIIYDVMYKRVGKEFDRKTKFLLETLLPLSLKKADCVVTISETSKADITYFYHYPVDKIFVVPPGIEIEEVRFDAHVKKELFDKLKIKSRFIAYIGNHERYKNIGRLLEAFKIISSDSKFNDVSLILIGKYDKHIRETIQKIEELQLGKKVILTGYVDKSELNILLKESELFVLPSLYEGFGIPLVEAMSMGVPVVTSNISSMPEVVGDAGMVFDPQNSNAMADIMKRVLLDDELKNKMIQRGLERVKTFDFKKSAGIFSTIINNIIQSKS